MRSKEVRAKTTKAVQGHKASLGGIFLAVIFLIIGIAAMNGGYTNVGPIFLGFGGLIVFISLIPMFNLPGWAMAIVVLGAVVLIVVFTVPYVETIFEEFNAFLDELPSRFFEWINPWS
jgi:hypothetical protein